MSGLSSGGLKQWMYDWVRDIFGGGDSTVTPHTMLRIAAVWYGITKISGHIAQLPIDVKWRLDQGAEDYKTHPWWKPLRGMANGYQTIDIFKEQIQGHALAWGNGRAAIIRGPYELIPLMPDRTITCMVMGEKYHVTKPDAEDRLWTFDSAVEDYEALVQEMQSNPEKTVVLHDRDVLHIQGFGYDGICGKSLYDVARDSLGIGLQAQGYQKNQLKKGFAGQLLLEAPAAMFRDEKAAKEFLDKFRKEHNSDQDGQTVGLLREGIKANVIAASPRDAQMVEKLKFDRQDVMLWLGLETIPGEEARGGYNGLTELNLAYLINCLGRWLTKWECQLNAKLRSDSESRVDRVYFKFNTKTLLKMDLQKTMETLGNGVTHTIFTVNEARDALDYPAVEGGDERVNPAIATNKEPEQKPEEKSDNAAAKATMARLVKIESDRVTSCCLKENFLESLDKFYAKWQRTIQDAVHEMRLDPVKEIDAMNARKAKCVELSGKVTTVVELTDAIQNETDTWRVKYA